jgi:hypothetical protein
MRVTEISATIYVLNAAMGCFFFNDKSCFSQRQQQDTGIHCDFTDRF